MTQEQRTRLEELADEIESIARGLPQSRTGTIMDDYTPRKKLFGAAWDVKQAARFGTPSFGV